ncbi:hypothetical protein CERZMDRAFT_102269 [Cercospora zeae-maydis SCOH1-5]|uniref:Uncharacterized protein n=1 Tax=Cercospora zeae-maydis SCOH1-5 TaxID=717836 RepID=A0A6A6F356_9PEZI|nr:hypothetical protein CERZMDRAFT_102269 [Cercospora zeae-maydis SCOH1-5]
MKHESGIEVYLIPANRNGDSVKYPELHYQQKLYWYERIFGTKETEAEHKSRHNCCFLRSHENQRFKIVVRFNEGFEMYSSSSILIGVGIGAKARYKWYPKTKKSFAVGKRIVLEGKGREGYGVPDFMESKYVISDEHPFHGITKYPRNDYANPGTLSVVAQRGGHDWLDGEGKPRKEQSKIGPDDPMKERPRKEKTFKYVYSGNGRRIRWEFRVRSLSASSLPAFRISPGTKGSPTPKDDSSWRKQQHTTIDLTEDTIADIREFKRERSGETEVKYQHVQIIDENREDEVEAELRNIRLRREEIQLERRQAELERKLKQMVAAKRQTNVKREIIEID